MALEIIQRPAFTVVGMNIRTRPKSPDIPALWPKFVPRIAEIQRQTEPEVAYGVMRHGQGSTDTLFYMAAVAVSPPGRAPSGMESLDIPAESYAVFRYPLAGVGQGFSEIFNRLLPSSGYAPIQAPYLERYDESFDADDAQSMVEILIPVRNE
jgi:AraC family transcriptional regulator